MDEITLWHPVLQVERPFPESAVPLVRASGWQPVQERDEQEAEQPVRLSAEQAMTGGCDLPARSAPKADWEAAARTAGVSDDEISGMTKDQLITRLTGQPATTEE